VLLLLNELVLAEESLDGDETDDAEDVVILEEETLEVVTLLD
jgi:hypothetical protein